MRLIAFACFGLMLFSDASAYAQVQTGPPGFTPMVEEDSDPDPSQEPRIFSGSGDSLNPYKHRYSDRTPRSRRLSDDREHVRTFQEPVSPAWILNEDPGLPRVWLFSEALLWWSKSSPLPVPVVTLGNPSDTTPGAIGQPGTSVLIGNQNIDLSSRGGAKFTFGFSFDAQQTWGLDLSYFSLARTTFTRGVSTDGSANSALLALPFYNPTIPGEDSTPIALSGAFAGDAILSLRSFLQGSDVNLIHNMVNSSGLRFDVLGGFRYLNLQEELGFTTDSPNVAPNSPGFFQTFDRFNANNNFYGGQVGVRGSCDLGRVFFNATTKLALGETFESISVNGGTFTNINGFAAAPGGYLSQPTNMGTQSHSQFAVVPETNFNFGLRLRPWASLIVGYSFLYVSSVARPGDQIDRVINPTQSPAINNNFPGNLSGPARPELNVNSASFWAQGLNFSLELRF